MAAPRKTNKIYKLVDVADNSTTIGHCILHKVRVHTVLSAHACPILDGTTSLWSLASTAPVGTEIDMDGVEVQDLIIDPDDVATGKILVTYTPF